MLAISLGPSLLKPRANKEVEMIARNRPHHARRLVLTALAAVLPLACGSGGSSGTPTAVSTPQPTPTPCTQSIVFQGQGSFPARILDEEFFATTATGRLDIILDWTFASSPIGVFVVPANSCSLSAFNARTCNFLVRSEPSTVKPRKISTPNFAPGNYGLLIANFASQDESIATQVILAQGGCAPLADGAPSINAAINAGTLHIERQTHGALTR
jgi:hypothetical protein